MIFAQALSMIMPRCPDPHRYAPHLARAMVDAEIDSVTRAAAFLGQLALESGELRFMEELADGSAYEGRQDLGNTEPGDGPRYKGRGPIQLTGRYNYRKAGEALGVPLESSPELAATPEVGFRVAAWYWRTHNLNEKADALNYQSITKAINGGLSHHDRRLVYYQKALEVLGISARVESLSEVVGPNT